LRVFDLATESDDKRYPYKSTGKREAQDSIRLDKGNAYKGQLHYIAEFVPALALKGVEFEHIPNELQRAVAGEDDDGDVGFDHSGSSQSSSSDEDQAVPEGITATTPVGATRKEHVSESSGSAATTSTTDVPKASSIAGKTGEGSHKDKEGVEMTRTELLEQRKYHRICQRCKLIVRLKNLALLFFMSNPGTCQKRRDLKFF